MIVAPTPGYYDDYPNKAVSPYYCWFRSLGYPDLDLVQWADGEWAIRQYHRSPVVPSLTPWNYVLTKIRHQEISYDFIKKYCGMLDITKRHYWDLEEEKTQEVEREHKETQRHAQDYAQRASLAITRNPDLMNRIAKNGLREMDLDRIVRHIPKRKLM